MIVIARDIEHDLSKMTKNLLDLARKECWNYIPNKTQFILTEIKMNDPNSPIKRRRKYMWRNSKKTPRSLSKVSYELEKFYLDIYDINLYIHKISKNKTIIDVRYFLKSSLNYELNTTLLQEKPMLHCKIPLPLYSDKNFGRYDVNWDKGGLRHWVNLFFLVSKTT